MSKQRLITDFNKKQNSAPKRKTPEPPPLQQHVHTAGNLDVDRVISFEPVDVKSKANANKGKRVPQISNSVWSNLQEFVDTQRQGKTPADALKSIGLPQLWTHCRTLENHPARSTLAARRSQCIKNNWRLDDAHSFPARGRRAFSAEEERELVK